VVELTREEREEVTVIAVFRAIEGKEKDLEKELSALQSNGTNCHAKKP